MKWKMKRTQRRMKSVKAWLSSPVATNALSFFSFIFQNEVLDAYFAHCSTHCDKHQARKKVGS